VIREGGGARGKGEIEREVSKADNKRGNAKESKETRREREKDRNRT